MKVKLAALFVATSVGGALGEVQVVTDIPPIHSLTSIIMGNTGTPELVVRPGASPHGYAMAPSEARALAAADVVIWVGPTLTPWLDRAIENLASDANSVELMSVPGVVLLPFREGAVFEAHDHADHEGEHEEHEEHGHEEHTDEEHEEHADEDHDGHDEHGAKEGEVDEHAHEEEAHHEEDHDEHAHDEHAHDDDAFDPHIWLDPRNAQAMTRAITAALIEADPANAAAYSENGDALIEDLQNLELILAETLAGATGHPFIVFHDAYHYFEARFDVEASGAISVSDAAAPGPARLSEIKGVIGALDAPCIFTEPQFPEANARLVMEGTDAKLAVLDPMGATLTPGPNVYGDVMRGMAVAMAGCLYR